MKNTLLYIYLILPNVLRFAKSVHLILHIIIFPIKKYMGGTAGKKGGLEDVIPNQYS